MQPIFEFDNERLFCIHNCKRVSVGDRGIFSNNIFHLGDTITKANFDISYILEVAEINNFNSESCFCYIDPETKNKVWTTYFYRVKQEGSKTSLCEGYTEEGGVCCGTCKYMIYNDNESDEFDSTIYCHKYSKEEKVEERGLCYLWERG